MGKLADAFVEWARKKGRWPLLLPLTIPVVLQVFQAYSGLQLPASVRHPAFVAITIGILALSAGLYLQARFGEQIRYSPRLRRKGTEQWIAVSDGVAWSRVSYTTSSGEARDCTLVSELASLVRGLPYRVVVVPQERIRTAHSAEDYSCDAFCVDGRAEGSALLLKAHMIFDERSLAKLERTLATDPQIGDNDDLVLPSRRFLPVAIPHRFELGLDPALPAEHRAAAIRLALRFELAVTLFYRDDPITARVFRDLLEVARTGAVPKALGVSLAGFYIAAAHELGAYEHDVERALEAVDLACQLAPDSGDAAALGAYFCLTRRDLTERGRSYLDRLPPEPRDAALPHLLLGAYYEATKRFDKAVEAYEAALPLETGEKLPTGSLDHFRALLHGKVGMLYSQWNGLSDRAMSDGMIRHLEEAIQLRPRLAAPHWLMGFAWALRSEGEMAERAFARATELSRSDSDLRWLGYWRARSLHALGRFPEAADEFQQLAGDLDRSDDPMILSRLARTLSHLDGRDHDVQRCFRRALTLIPDDGHIHYEYARALAASMDRCLPPPPRPVASTIRRARSCSRRSVSAKDRQKSTRGSAGCIGAPAMW